MKRWIMPENTDWAIEQNKHEPTRSYGEEIFNVVKDIFYLNGTKGTEDINVLEIGCAWGVSTLAILMANPKIRLTSVDSNPKTHANQEVEENHFRHRWNFIHANSEDFWRMNGNKFDLVYIDGSHKYPVCQTDIFEGWEALEPGGILIADDFTHPKNQVVDKDGTTVEYGVSFAVCNLIKEKKITRIDSTTRLFIAYK